MEGLALAVAESSHSPVVFAYLSTETPATEDALLAVAGSGIPSRAYVRRMDEALRAQADQVGDGGARRAGRAGRVVAGFDGDRPPRGPRTLERGLGGGSAAVGLPRQPGTPPHRPPACRPLGVAHFFTGRFPVETIRGALRQLLSDPSFARRAREVAADVAGRGPWEPIPAIVARCRQLITEGPNEGFEKISE